MLSAAIITTPTYAAPIPGIIATKSKTEQNSAINKPGIKENVVSLETRLVLVRQLTIGHSSGEKDQKLK